MKTSQYLLATTRETPAEAEIISHQLMLRAGLIRRLAGGLYTWLPLGLRVLRKVENIIRQEMDKTGAQELLMPLVQPAELWEESGRWQEYGAELLRLKDRHQREFCLGPTHEEVITDLIRKEIRSYKQLPANFYQIQTKFRDEIRPRFGVMRSREFIMKDAYSFHLDRESLETTYQTMFDSYHRIFERMNLNFRAVQADTGSIGGDGSHEFHVLADSGEDAIAFSTESEFAANIEFAEAISPLQSRPQASQTLQEVATPNVQTIEEVCEFFKTDAKQIIKTLLVEGATKEHPVVALVLRGDHELNEIKTEKHELVASPLNFATPEQIYDVAACDAGSIGPIGLSIPMIVDRSAAVMADFICGANKTGFHLSGVNWERDLELVPGLVADIRNVVEGDPSPDGKGTIQIRRGIEVGHIFQLGDTYSKAFNANVLNENSRAQILEMGCYGIGVTRVIAAAIEQNHDEKGIIWPDSLAPFQVCIVPMQMHKSPRVQQAAHELYQQLTDQGIDVLFDDRNERPGVMFNDMELIGIPHRIVIGERGLDEGKIEYKHRRDKDSQNIDQAEFFDFLIEKLQPSK